MAADEPKAKRRRWSKNLNSSNGPTEALGLLVAPSPVLCCSLPPSCLGGTLHAPSKSKLAAIASAVIDLEGDEQSERSATSPVAVVAGQPQPLGFDSDVAKKKLGSGALALLAQEVEYPEYPVGKLPAQDKLIHLYGLMNARETVARNRAAGFDGPLAYNGVPEQYAAYLRRRICPNVRRREDRTTLGLKRFCAAEERLQLCRSEHERRRMLKLLVFNFGFWRFIGGTVAFAGETGFFSSWGAVEKQQVRDIVSRAFHEGRVPVLFTAAYQSAGQIRNLLTAAGADELSLQAALFNTGPKAVPNKEPDVTFKSLVGKLRVMDRLWDAAEDVVIAAAPDLKTGLTRSRPVADVLAKLPYFGIKEPGGRVPTFFAKELLQDLLDTPVFQGGRAKVQDLRTFTPAGPGALEGLRLLYGGNRGQKPTQKQAIPQMRALLAAASGPLGWVHGDPAELELHDIQFMLCELQKFLHNGNHLRNYLGPQQLSMLPPTSSIWQTRLEEAVALKVISVSTGPELPCAALARALASWLGVASEDFPRWGQSCEVKSGDRVVLRVAGARARPLSLGDAPDCLLRAPYEDDDCASATVFRVERAEGHGPLLTGEPFFLRAPNGAHLGPLRTLDPYILRAPGGAQLDTPKDGALAAQPSSGRFASERRLALLPATSSASCGKVVSSGDELVLLPFSTVKQANQASAQWLTVVVELDPGAKEAAHRSIDAVARAVEAATQRGVLCWGAGGRLQLANAEEVRKRLVG